MKVIVVLMAIFQSLWSIELGFLSFRYGVGLNLFWTFLVLLGIAIVDFNIYYYCLEKIYQLLKNRSLVAKCLEKFRLSGVDNHWVYKCWRWHYLGLFFAGFIPHFLLVGITTQKIFRLKNGYWFLFFGNVLKIVAMAYGFKIFESLISY